MTSSICFPASGNGPTSISVTGTLSGGEAQRVKLANELARRGITDLLPAHGAVLHALFKESPQPMSTLARRIGRKKNTVTGLVDTLQERGYCRRRPSDQDARVQLVSLSQRGEALRHVQTDISAALHRRLWQDIPPADQAACMTVLDGVLHNLAR